MFVDYLIIKLIVRTLCLGSERTEYVQVPTINLLDKKMRIQLFDLNSNSAAEIDIGHSQQNELDNGKKRRREFKTAEIFMTTWWCILV